MPHKHFCTIFVIGYNLITYTNNNHIRTRAVSLQVNHWTFIKKKKLVEEKSKNITVLG